MSREISSFQNRTVGKGLYEVYMENEKSDDGACVEFSDELIAPVDLARVSEIFQTSMEILFNPFAANDPYVGPRGMPKDPGCFGQLPTFRSLK
jgi:hypothetical protein